MSVVKICALFLFTGRSPTHREPTDEVGPFAARAGMVNTLKQLGFQSIHVYDEVRCRKNSLSS